MKLSTVALVPAFLLAFGIAGAQAGQSTQKPIAVPVGFAELIARHAGEQGVPVKLAAAVVQVESRFNPTVTGSAGEIGLMQIKLQTARGLGYKGSREALYSPELNIKYGMLYLAGAHERAGGDVCGTVMRYNAGHYAKRMTAGTRAYCGKVRRIMASA